MKEKISKKIEQESREIYKFKEKLAEQAQQLMLKDLTPSKDRKWWWEQADSLGDAVGRNHPRNTQERLLRW